MRVTLFNGSPNEKGCTYTALKEVSAELERNGIETEIINVGKAGVRGCSACGYCKRLNEGKCVYIDDCVNECIKKAAASDGLIFGSPVYYGGMSGNLTSFMDRLFYASNGRLAYKPAAAVVSLRRSGATDTFDAINRYFMLSLMPVVSSQYWNNVHGNTPDEVKLDLEGMQTMRVLGKNMAWMLKCIDLGKKSGMDIPKLDERIYTNFIR